MAKYNNAIRNEIIEWVAENGLMDYGGARKGQLVEYFHIDRKTFDKWLLKPDFKKAINEAKETWKASKAHELVLTLMKSATGFEYDKEKEHKEYRPNADGSQGRLTKKVVDKEKGYCPPNVGAAIFLLTNLDPEHYQNRQKSDIQIKKDDDAKEMTMDEINAEIARLQQLNQE